MDIYDVVDKQRAALLAKEYDTVKDIVRAYEYAEKQVENSIRAFQAKIDYAQKAGLEPSLSWYYQEARLENILREIRGHLDTFSTEALMFSTSGRDNAYELGAVHAARLSEMQVYGDVAGLNAGAFANAQALLSSNSPLKELFDVIGPLAAVKAREVFAKAIAEGWNPRKMATVLKREVEGLSKNRAVLIARTEMIRAYRTANKDIYERNDDVLRGWRWTCAKTPATCGLCLALDGEIYPTNKVLVSHPACRCTMVPLPKTDFGGPQPKSGEEYFKNLPPTDQDRILGKTKASMYREGKITLKDNVGFKDSPQWGRQPVPKRLKDLSDGYKANQLPSQRGIHKVSTFEPAPARKLSDLLTATERKANDPVTQAKAKWDLIKEDKFGDRRPTFPIVKKAPEYKKTLGTSPKALEPLESTIETVQFNKLTSTLQWAKGAKVTQAIEALGDGPDLPIIFRDGETLYIHNGESLHRLQAKAMLGQTQATVRVYDVSQIAKPLSPVDEIQTELTALGVKTVTRLDDVTDADYLQSLEFARDQIKATGVAPTEISVRNIKMQPYVVATKATAKTTNTLFVVPTNRIVPNKTKAELEDLIKNNLMGTAPKSNPLLNALKTKQFTVHSDINEFSQSYLLYSLFDEDKLKAVWPSMLKFSKNNYDLPSYQMFGVEHTTALRELITLYQRGEYRMGSIAKEFEDEFLLQAEKILGKKKQLPKYTDEENLYFFQTGTQAGSNPGGKYLGRDGIERYIKIYDDSDKAWAEHVSMKFYELFDAGTETSVFVGADGKTRIASVMLNGRTAMMSDAKEILQAYTMDAFLANWDVIGAGFDNVLSVNGTIRRIDAGGTWFYRAKATTEKPASVCSTLGEWTSLGFDPRGQMTVLMQKAGYNTIEDAADFLLAQGTELKKKLDAIGVDETDWTIYLKQIAPGMSGKTRARIVDMIMDRRDSLGIKLIEMQDIIDQKSAAAVAAQKAKKKKPAAAKVAVDQWDADNWVNKAERDRVRTEYERIAGAQGYAETQQLIEDFTNDPDLIVMRNEKATTLLQYFQGPEPNGGPPRFKSQFETGTSQGALSPSLRKRVEKWLFKLFGRNVKNKQDSVIYGWTTTRQKRMNGHNPASWYGDVSCIMKKEVRRRTTITAGDSLGQDYVPTPLLDPGPEWFGNTGNDVRRGAAMAKSAGGIKAGTGSYYEVQIHGQLSIEDIEEFIYTPARQGTGISASAQKTVDELTKLAAKYGIKLTIL